MKKSFLRRKSLNADMALQITSMADIFMILLVFLLKSYATSITNIAPSAHISLPEVDQARSVPKESMKIEIGKDAVTIDEKPALGLTNYQFSDAEQAGGET